MPQDIVDQTRTKMDSFFKAVPWIGGVLIFVFLALGVLLMIGSPDPSGKSADIPYLKIVLTVGLIAAVAGIFLIGFKGGGTKTFESGSFLMRVFTFFLVLAALDFALYSLNPSAPLFTTTEGHMHLAAYAVLAVIAAMIDANLGGKMKWSALAMLFVVFAIIGPRTGMLLDPDGSVAQKLHLTRSDSSYRSVAVKRQCKGVYEKHILTSSPSSMENGADCWFNYGVKSGTVRFLTEDNQYVDVEAGREIALDRNIKFVKWRAIGDQAVVHAVFCNRGKSWNGMGCI